MKTALLIATLLASLFASRTEAPTCGTCMPPPPLTCGTCQ